MPELPEVENVRRSLVKQLPSKPQLVAIHYYRKDLRFKIPVEPLETLLGGELREISRRGKYLLFHFTEGFLISHLGMTGQWRLARDLKEKKSHDHVVLQFSQDTTSPHPTAFYLIYNDPRRFGYLEFAKDEPSLAEHPLFRSLGVEPLSEHFNIPYLLKKGRHSERYVKTFIMDQKVVVGIGNIYASEILFQAKIKPKKKAGRITADQWKNLIQSTQHILHDSIEAGGSTIRDYRNAEGESGDYQSHHHVYDREGLNCDVCGTPIKHEVIGGRSTYWCPQCQK